MKAGIIGCGAIFPMHSMSLAELPGVSLSAVCDINEDRAKAAALKNNCKMYTDYKMMIDNEDLDVVHICTPHYLHSEMAVYALNAGKHVLTEKPMSIKLDDAREMNKAAKASNRILGVIFQNRYNSGSVLIKKTLESGRLGRLISAKCLVTWYRTDDYYASSDWRGTWDKEGGGVVINQSIHTLDLMRWFVDSDIDYIDANISNRIHKSVEVEDVAEGIIMYKNGVITSFYTMIYHTYNAPVELELHCENGIAKLVADKATITFNDGTVLTDDIMKDESIDYGNVKNYWGISHYKQIRNFYEAVANGTQPDISGEDAIKTQAMICGIYESGKTHKRVYL